MQQQQPTAAQTVDAMQANLTKAFVERHDAESVIKRCDETITAIRNVLAGVQVGQKLSQEQAAPAPTAE